MDERLMARERQARESGEDDPVRKRLFFLLAALKRQRRATEKSLATGEDIGRVAAFFCRINATVASILTAALQPDVVSREHFNSGNETANRWLHQGATADNDLRKRGWTEGEIEVDRHHREARARREGERLGAAVGDALHHPPIHRLPMDVELSGDFCLAHPLLEERGRFEPPSFERIEIPPHPHRIPHAARIAQSDALVTILREIQ